MPSENQQYTILMFTMSTWREWESGIRNRNYFVLQELLKRPEVERIIAVEYLPITWRRKAKTLWKQITNYELRITNKTFQISEKLTVCSVMRLKTLNAYLKAIIAKFQPRKLSGPNSKFILWSYFPLSVDYFDTIPAGLKIFDAVDDWSEHPSYTHYKQTLKENYQKIKEKADIIFTVSEDLRDRLFGGREDVYWVKNGVDYERITNYELRITNKDKKTTVGYIGTIQERVDFDLVRYAAQKHPDKQFVFVGPIWNDAEVEKVKSLPNVTFTARVPYDKVGEYLAKFDAAIIPHKVNEFTRSMDPMKLYEYIACGLPVISTIDYGKEFCYFAQTPDEFEEAITRALREDSEELAQKRRAFAQENSWEKRVGEMMEIIENFNATG